MKGPVPKNEAERLKALLSYEILDTKPEAELDRLAELASLICNTPLAMINLIDKDRQWFKARGGFDTESDPRQHSICQYTILEDKILEIPDATKDERVKNLPIVLAPNGIRFYSGCPLFDPDGYILGTLCVFDYKPGKLSKTQKRALEILSKEVIDQIVARKHREELQEVRKIAIKNAQARELFLANMSHEIRTPLNAIIGFANLLTNTKVDPEQSDYVKTINLASQSLLATINNVLDVSKIESGSIWAESIPFNFAELIHTVEQVQEIKASERGLDLFTKIDKRIPAWVAGDPTRLNQILLNLVDNAIKFTENGNVALKTAMVSQDEDNVYIKFTITDTGIGIEPEKIERIFERFVQADEQTTRKYGGTGLGLNISRSLTELLGGKLEVDSKPGKGSSFYFTIPLQKMAKPDKVDGVEGLTVKSVPTIPPKVLLVEDNNLNIKLALRVLTNFGYEPDLAENGKIAVDKVRQNTYDLIIMDLQMPEMDGYQATLHIRNKLKIRTPILAMTAHSLGGEREKCFEVGMNDYISKPFNPDELYEKTRYLLSIQDTPTPSVKRQKSETAIPEAPPESAPSQKGNKFVDPARLQQMSEGDKDFEAETIQTFLEITPKELMNLEKAAGREDYTEVCRLAHKLNSSFGFMGVLEDGALKTIENHAKNNKPVSIIKKNINKLNDIFEEVKRFYVNYT